MMKSSLRLAAPLSLLLVLAACETETIDPNAEANAAASEAQNKAAALPPPPMIQASRTYRCKDNSLLYADFYTNDTVQVRPAKDQPGTTLTAAAGQPPYTAEGYSLSANSEQISYTAPGKGTQTCKA